VNGANDAYESDEKGSTIDFEKGIFLRTFPRIQLMFISGAHIAVVGIGRRNNLKCVPVFNGSENREAERECCAEIFAGDTQKIFEIYGAPFSSDS